MTNSAMSHPASGAADASVVPLAGGSAQLLAMTPREQRAQAEAWLYATAKDPQTAADEFTRQGVAILTAGIVFDAVRVPLGVLDPALDRETEPSVLRQRLHALRLFGPVFCDPYRPNLYFLVPPGTDRQWSDTLNRHLVECMGGTKPYTRHLGVPRIDFVAPPKGTPSKMYWLSPPDAGNRLVNPQHLYQVLTQRVEAAAGNAH